MLKTTVLVVDSQATVEEVFAQYPGRDAAFYKRIYRLVLTEEQREQFVALPVDRQIGLLKVPVRRQNRYRKSGITAYLDSKAQARNPNRINKWDRADEKRNLQTLK